VPQCRSMLDASRFLLYCFVSIFTIVNPVSAAALLVSLTPGESDLRRREQALRAVLFMTTLMVGTYFVGAQVLQLFSISMPSLALAAGVLVARSGFRSVAGADRLTPAQREEGIAKSDISLTPLGMPMLAGPGTIAVLIGLSTEARGLAANLAALVAMLLVSATSYAVLWAAPAVVARLGRTGEAALTKLMGLIILCVGIEFLIRGISEVLRAVNVPA